MEIPRCTPDPAEWVEELQWHQAAFKKSMFRWMPEEAMALALRWTNGKVEYTTVGDWRTLEGQIEALRLDAVSLDRSLLPLLHEAQQRSRPSDWAEGLKLVGLSDMYVEILRAGATRIEKESLTHPQAHRIMRLDLPYRNPFTFLWEMRQLRDLYDAAQFVLEDTFYDLAGELAATHGWNTLAAVSAATPSADLLRDQTATRIEDRGAPGDPRRQPRQRFAPAYCVPFGCRPGPSRRKAL